MQRVPARQWIQRAFLLAALLTLGGWPWAHAEPVFDLISVRFEDGEIARLHGECQFYWGHLLTPADFRKGKSPSGLTVRIPRSWTEYQNGDMAFPAEGCATYRILCAIPAFREGRMMGLQIPAIYSSCRVWINGWLKHEVGRVAPMQYESQAEAAVQTIPFFQPGTQASVDTVEIIIQVSNVAYSRSGIREALELGELKPVAVLVKKRNAFGNLLVGAMLLLVLAHSLFFLFRRRRVANIWLLLTYIFLICQAITGHEHLLLQWFSPMSWELFQLFRHLGLLVPAITITLYLGELYSQEMTRSRVWPLIIAGGLLILTILVSPPSFYSRFREVFVIYILVTELALIGWFLPTAMRRHRPQAWVAWLGLLILVAGSAIDIYIRAKDIPTLVSLPMISITAFMSIYTYGNTMHLTSILSRMDAIIERLRIENNTLSTKVNTAIDEREERRLDLLQLERQESLREWAANGQRQLAQVLAENRDNFSELCRLALEQQAKYLNVNIATLYIGRISQSTMELQLEMAASYGLNETQRTQNAIIPIGYGLVGACYADNTFQHLTNLPKETLQINSGLGSCPPPALILQPLESDSGVIGVLELGRFKPFKSHEVKFVKENSRLLSNSIMNTKTNQEHLAFMETQGQKLALLENRCREFEEKVEILEAALDEKKRAGSDQ